MVSDDLDNLLAFLQELLRAPNCSVNIVTHMQEGVTKDTFEAFEPTGGYTVTIVAHRMRQA